MWTVVRICYTFLLTILCPIFLIVVLVCLRARVSVCGAQRRIKPIISSKYGTAGSWRAPGAFRCWHVLMRGQQGTEKATMTQCRCIFWCIFICFIPFLLSLLFCLVQWFASVWFSLKCNSRSHKAAAAIKNLTKAVGVYFWKKVYELWHKSWYKWKEILLNQIINV